MRDEYNCFGFYSNDVIVQLVNQFIVIQHTRVRQCTTLLPVLLFIEQLN